MVQANQAKLFLGLNAEFSIVSGILLLFFSHSLANILFTTALDWHSWLLWAIGVGCLIFALLLFRLIRSKKLNRNWVMKVVWADVAWVLASAIILLVYSSYFTAAGFWITAGVGAVVGMFAFGQTLGASKIKHYDGNVALENNNDSFTMTLTQPVNALSETVWDVMNDHPGYADVAENLSKVEVISGSGLGMIRQCFGPNGESWTETCDQFEDYHMFGFTVHTENPDYPYPFSYLNGEWSVKACGEQSGFTIKITVTPKGNRLTLWLFHWLAVPKFTAVLLKLGEAWSTKMSESDRYRLNEAS